MTRLSLVKHNKDSLYRVGNKLVPLDFTDLTGLWLFGEGSGNTLYDRSGNGNNGSLDSPIWVWDSTRKKYVLSFDGTDDTVDLGTGVDVQGWSEFSVAAWVNIDNAEDDEHSEVINIQDFSIRLAKTSGNDWKILYRDESTGYANTINAFGDSGDWTHLVGVFDGSELELYRNGVGSGSPTATTADVRSDRSGAKSAIGSLHNGNDRFFDGMIDDVRIYNRALTSTEITNLYNKTKP